MLILDKRQYSLTTHRIHGTSLWRPSASSHKYTERLSKRDNTRVIGPRFVKCYCYFYTVQILDRKQLHTPAGVYLKSADDIFRSEHGIFKMKKITQTWTLPARYCSVCFRTTWSIPRHLVDSLSTNRNHFKKITSLLKACVYAHACIFTLPSAMFQKYLKCY